MEIKLHPNLFKREKYLAKIRGFYNECEVIKVLTGVGRSGKSSIMNLIIAELLESRISSSNILYFNLDSRGVCFFSVA